MARVVAITTVRNEIDMLPLNVEHLLAEGVERVLVTDGGSTDGTPEWFLGKNYPVSIYRQDGPFDQSRIMTDLAAKCLDADWVIPFDADEFWYAPCGATIAETLATVPDQVTKLAARSFGHTDWTHRHVHPKRLPKMAFRPAPGAVIAWGNHDVTRDGETWAGVLDLRELQYRSWEHFLAKVAKMRELFATNDFPEVYGSHQRRLAAMTTEELEAEWVQLQAEPTIYDPVPSRSSSHSSTSGYSPGPASQRWSGRHLTLS